MRLLLPVLTLAVAAAALAPSHAARAWWDRWGRWHYFYRPPVVYAPPPPYYVSPYPAPPAVWVPPHYRWGHFIPGHWL